MIGARLAIEGVWKSFGRRPILRNASVWAYPGAVTVLFGRNGEGKTTLLRCGLGLLRTGVGVTILDDRRFHRPSLAVLARAGLFYLPDRDLFSTAIRLRRQLPALCAQFDDVDMERVTEAVADPTLLDRRADELASGERRLLELGFAAARKPRVLIADEPLRGLAPRASEAISDGLRRIAAAGCAVLVTGHETRPLLELGDHIVWMTGGTTHHLGDRRAALAHDQFRGSYLRDL